MTSQCDYAQVSLCAVFDMTEIKNFTFLNGKSTGKENQNQKIIFDIHIRMPSKKNSVIHTLRWFLQFLAAHNLGIQFISTGYGCFINKLDSSKPGLSTATLIKAMMIISSEMSRELRHVGVPHKNLPPVL